MIISLWRIKMKFKGKYKKCDYSGCNKQIYAGPKRLGKYKSSCCCIDHSKLYKQETMMNRFWAKVDKTPGLGPEGDCWEWIGSYASHGYGSFKGSNKTYSTHRLSWEQANNTTAPSDMHVCHSCDNPRCCNPTHLWLGTPKQNMEDMAKKGRHGNSGKYGEFCPSHKFTEKEILEIRKALQSKQYTYEQIGEIYHISPAYLTKLAYGETWMYLNLSKLDIEKKLERGENKYNSVLTDSQVDWFKKLKLMGYKDAEAARMAEFPNLRLAYNISNSTQWQGIITTEFSPEDKQKAEEQYKSIESPKCGQRLTLEIAREIRNLNSEGVSATHIAEVYKISITAVCNILKEKTWKE